MARVITLKELQDYINLSFQRGKLDFIPAHASEITISNFVKLSGWRTNDLYSFSLSFNDEGAKVNYSLIVKVYLESVDPWFKAYDPGGDVRKYVREFEALQVLSDKGFPVPRAYHCESDIQFFGYPFIIMQKEELIGDCSEHLDSFAAVLAHLHNIKINELNLKALLPPRDEYVFAKSWSSRFNYILQSNKTSAKLKNSLESSLRWIQSHATDNPCFNYSLVHGDYHPRNVFITKDQKLCVLDWEGIEIGDPAYDVGFAYHVIKIFNNTKNPDLAEDVAERFVSEYMKNAEKNIDKRLDFYKITGILGLAVLLSSVLKNPVQLYHKYGLKAFLAWPFVSFPSVARFLDTQFIAYTLKYSEDYLRTHIM